MKVLFLYSEVATYFLNSLETFCHIFQAEAHVVRWPINPEAPFQFRAYEGVTFYERNELDTQSIFGLFDKIKPDVVYVSGWMDKGYLKVARRIKKTGVPIIGGSDNQWTGAIRQKIGALISKQYLHNAFTHLWVPGRFQFEFARRMGFPRENILMGMYAADTAAFTNAYERSKETKKETYPHTFLYVGRFVEIKGIRELVKSFLILKNEMPNNWKLKLVGAGDLKNELLAHEDIQLFDFVQPGKLPALFARAGCFILPSHVEPWGVVLHEAAASGLPLIAAEKVGARDAFLRDGYNGYCFSHEKTGDFQASLRMVIERSDEELRTFGRRSFALSKTISPEIWAHTLASVLDRK